MRAMNGPFASGVLVSTSSYASLSEQAKFAVHNDHEKQTAPTLDDFRHGRIVFQERRDEYVGQMLALLTQDTLLDQAFKRAAALFDTDSYFTPLDEADHDLLIRRHMLGDGCTECNFIQDIVRDYLKFPDPAQAAAIRKSKGRRETRGLCQRRPAIRPRCRKSRCAASALHTLCRTVEGTGAAGRRAHRSVTCSKSMFSRSRNSHLPAQKPLSAAMKIGASQWALAARTKLRNIA